MQKSTNETDLFENVRVSGRKLIRLLHGGPYFIPERCEFIQVHRVEFLVVNRFHQDTCLELGATEHETAVYCRMEGNDRLCEITISICLLG